MFRDEPLLLCKPSRLRDFAGNARRQGPVTNNKFRLYKFWVEAGEGLLSGGRGSVGALYQILTGRQA